MQLSGLRCERNYESTSVHTETLDDETTATYDWEYTEDTVEDSIGVGIYIMPDGTIDIDVIQTT